MNSRHRSILSFVLLPAMLIAILLTVTAGDGFADAAASDLGCSTMHVSGGVTSYSGCSYSGSRAPAEAAMTARRFIADHASVLNLDSGTADELALIEVKHGLASTHTRFEQVFNGYPVFGGAFTVSQGPDGSVTTLHSSYAVGLDVVRESSAENNQREAETLALQAAEAMGLRHPSAARLVWFPQKQQATLAWEVMVYSSVPLGDFLTLVDAQSGDILFQENRIAFDNGTGQIYYPNPYQTQGSSTGLTDANDADSAALTAQRFSVTLERLNSGTGLLQGDWVDLASLNSSTIADVDANEADRNYDYTRSDARFEQVTIYHTVDQINEWFHDLGFDDDTGTPNGIRDFPSLANAHWFDDDQSFYSTGDDAIHFGDGGVDDGEDGDIVAHEYGHAIQHNQNSSWGGGDMGAMGEGFGDYLAAAFFVGDGPLSFQSAHAPCVGEWDATSYSSTNPPCLRRVDGNKIYPDDLNGSVHADGEIWSRALWDIHGTIGRDTTMQLVLEHHFGLPGSATMPTAALALIQADVDLNAGANDAAIRDAFCERGILEDPNCAPPVPQATLSIGTITWSDASGNDNGYADPGETITMTVELVNNGTLTATDVTATMTNPGGGAMMGTPTSAYGDIAAAGTGSNLVAFSFAVDEATCGNQINLAMTASYHNGINSGTQATGAHSLDVGRFEGETNNYAWTGTLAIPDNSATGASQDLVTLDAGDIYDVDVNITANHTYVGDLRMSLSHNGGTPVVIMERPSGCSAEDVDVTLDDDASDAVEDACSTTPPAIGGTLAPSNALSAFNGQAIDSNWTLTVVDNAGVDTGALTAFSLDITSGEFVCDALVVTPPPLFLPMIFGGE